jgi:hypothetical protein
MSHSQHAFTKGLEKEMFQTSCKVGITHLTFAARFNRKWPRLKKEKRKIKSFSFQIWKVKKFSYLCTPNNK